MPELLSAALFERDERVLAAHRRHAPFSGQWTLPLTIVRSDETAEEALRRHAREQFGVGLAQETFLDTVYLEDPVGAHRYVANVFRAEIAGAPMRFRSDGEYDDARWLTVPDLEQVRMPAPLRGSAVRALGGEVSEPPEADWAAVEAEVAAEAPPLGERAEAPAEDEAPAPDNAAGWDAIAKAYQEERYGERNAGALMWSWRASEDDLHVLGDVRGKRAIVLGCGGGQDAVALAKMGAVAVGVDRSGEQLAFAKKHAARHGAENASFVEGDIEDLSRFDDASFDLALSIHALDYVEHADRALAEAARVLRPGGLLAFAVKHPFDLCVDATDGGPPFVLYAPYWRERQDWTWEFKSGASASFRQYPRTMSDWFDLVTGAGFAVERLIEPKEDTLPRVMDDELSDEWMRMLPYTLVVKARKR